MNTQKFKIQFILLGIAICLVAEVAVYSLNHAFGLWSPIVNVQVPERLGIFYPERHAGGGMFTNPLLECGGEAGMNSYTEFRISEPDLNDFVSKTTSKYSLSLMSVYLRDLNNGPWIGINEDKQFIGGSLLKVPLLISYLKWSESNPMLLSKKIEYKSEITSNVQYYSPSKQITAGHAYTVEELLQYMIEYSDNNAAELLFENIDKNEFNKVFVALGMGDPDPNNPYSVTTKTYSSFFRILYNASYLNIANSEKALLMLSKAEFNRGLQAGIPSSLAVSHKFGIRSDGDVNQLHDCGIVYYPDHPYLLCVMSRGGTFDDMAKSIAEVSKYVYKNIENLQNK